MLRRPQRSSLFPYTSLIPAPLITGTIVVVPKPGPTNAGLLAHIRSDRKSAVKGKRVDLGGRRIIKKKTPPAVAVTGALLIVYEPFSFVTSKLARPVPLITGTIVVVPKPGPTNAGLLAHIRSPL